MSHSEDFNFYYNSAGHFVIGSDPSTSSGNGAYNKSIVDAILPRSFNGIMIYGTGYNSLSKLSSLKTVFVPSTYKLISSDTFHGSTELESVTFEDPKNILDVGFWLFVNSKISTFTFPYNAKRIRIHNSFRGCKNLKSLYYQGMLDVPYDDKTFDGVPDDLKIFVRSDFPYDTFGGRSVIKVLPRPVDTKTLRCKHQANNRISLDTYSQ